MKRGGIVHMIQIFGSVSERYDAAATDRRSAIFIGGPYPTLCIPEYNYTHSVNTLAKALNGNNTKTVIVEAHPYAIELGCVDISISSAEQMGDTLYLMQNYYQCTTDKNAKPQHLVRCGQYCML